MISVKTAKLIFKKAGANKIGLKAVSALRKILEQKAQEIAEKAVKNASYAGRITIKEADVTEEQFQSKERIKKREV